MNLPATRQPAQPPAVRSRPADLRGTLIRALAAFAACAAGAQVLADVPAVRDWWFVTALVVASLTAVVRLRR